MVAPHAAPGFTRIPAISQPLSNQRLRYLYEVATNGSMRAAGEKLGVAVSSISRQLAKLEKDLGVPLLERAGRTIKLTEAGELALNYYRDCVAGEEAFATHMRELRGSRTGRVSIACGEAFLGKELSQFVLNCLQDSPGATIHIKTAPTSEVIRYVSEDEMHMGLVLHAPADPKIRVRCSVSQPIKALMHPSHPLAGQAQVSLKAVGAHALCLPERGFRLRQLIGQAEAQDGVVLNEKLASNSLALLKDLVKTGRFVTLLPDIAAVNELSHGELIAVPIISPSLEKISVNLVCRLGRQLSGIPGRLLSALEAALRSWALRVNSTPPA